MRQRRIKASKGRERVRRFVNVMMLGLTGLATLIALVPLVWIIVEVFARGSQALTIDFPYPDVQAHFHGRRRGYCMPS